MSKPDARRSAGRCHSMTTERTFVAVLREAVAAADWDEVKSVEQLRREAIIGLWRLGIHRAIYEALNEIQRSPSE